MHKYYREHESDETTLTAAIVEQARSDEKLFNTVYRKIFYRNGIDIMNVWLFKNGVRNEHDRKELYSDMIFVLLDSMPFYQHDAVPFEKWIWYKFKQKLMAWKKERTQYRKKTDIFFLSNEAMNKIDEGTDNDRLKNAAQSTDAFYAAKYRHVMSHKHNGFSAFECDYSVILSTLSTTEAQVLELRLKKGCGVKEICSTLSIRRHEYDGILNRIVEKLRDYLNH